MTRPILVIQTAFAGDLVLTTPLIEDAAVSHPGAPIDVLCIPSTAPLLGGNPFIRNIIVYDKHRRSPSLATMMRRLRSEGYALCLCPHRSLRSALLARATGAPRRIAFDRSAGRCLFTETVAYDPDAHEVDRNRALLRRSGNQDPEIRNPKLYPSAVQRAEAARVAWGDVRLTAEETMTAPTPDVVAAETGTEDPPYVCIAPGSVWATKRWTEIGFAQVVRHFSRRYRVILLGGSEDRALCDRIEGIANASGEVVNAAGTLGFLASAALIEGAALLISNDSAPVHLASAMGTPVVEIYGATSPSFGFSPYGVPHRIVEKHGLACRPCAIHGGDRCPIGTFVCMRELTADAVIHAAGELLG